MANNTTFAGGQLYVWSDGTANSTILNSGRLYVSNGGTANSTTVNSGGHLYISRGGTAKNATLYANGVLNVGTSAQAVQIVISSGTANISSGALASGGTASLGGAYCNLGGVMNVNGAVFSANSAGSQGGAIFNCGSVCIGTSAVFSGNSTGDRGGAIFNSDGGYMSIGSGISFFRNSALFGAALANAGSMMSIGQQAVFSGNSAGSRGGAIYNLSSMSVDSGALFAGNYASDFGGAIFNWNSMTLNKNAIFSGNSVGYEGGAIGNGGSMYIDSEALFSGNLAPLGGAIFNHDSSTMGLGSYVVFSGNVVDKRGGAIYNNAGINIGTSAVFSENSAGVGGGAIYNNKNIFIDSGAVFAGNSAGNQGGAINNHGSVCIKNNTVFSGNKAAEGGAIYNCSGAVMSIADTKFLTASDTIANKGTMSFSGSVSLAGNLYTDTTITATGANITFDISSYSEANTTGIISNLSKISGASGWTITVNTDQATGTYVLAQGASGFSCTVTVKTTVGDELGSLNVGGTLTADGITYSLALADSTLKLTVSGSSNKPTDLAGNSSGISWSGGAESYVAAYTQDSYAHSLQIGTAQTAIDTYGMTGTYAWRVRNDNSKTWADGSAITAESSVSPQTLASDADGVGDLFFGKAAGVWANTYIAQHLGTDSWQGTGEYAELAGKNKITDVFAGSTDANILVLTDDENGDALFVDDIYSAFPAEQKARLAQIDEIRAGAGNDVVDLTSQRFDYTNGVTLRGGDGNDVLWANCGENQLFGDSGDDRIVGASGDDVIAGGAGNDTLNGGGGVDIFCFCSDWGMDSVEQLSDGSVTLWFAAKGGTWNQETLTYTEGDNSVTVKGALDITLKFGDDGSAQYDTLVSAGAFLEASSFTIFEEKGKGVIAKLG